MEGANKIEMQKQTGNPHTPVSFDKYENQMRSEQTCSVLTQLAGAVDWNEPYLSDYFHKTRSVWKTCRSGISLLIKGPFLRGAWVVTFATAPSALSCSPTWPSVPQWAQRRSKDDRDVSCARHCVPPPAAGTDRHKQHNKSAKKKKVWELIISLYFLLFWQTTFYILHSFFQKMFQKIGVFYCFMLLFVSSLRKECNHVKLAQV